MTAVVLPDLCAVTTSVALLPVPALVYDPADLRILAANGPAAAQYGYDVERLLESDLRLLHPAEDAQAVEDFIQQGMDDGRRASRWRQVRADGSTMWVEITSGPVQVGDRPLRCATLRDVTEAEDHRSRVAAVAAALQVTEDVVVMTGPPTGPRAELRIVEVNGTFARLTGWSAEEAIGRDPHFLLHRDADGEELRALQQAVKDGRPERVELLHARRDGTPFWAELVMSPLRDGDGTVRNVIFILRDVTERRRMHEEALHATRLEAAGRLAGPLAHDFGNLLTIIETAAQLTRLDLPDEGPGLEAIDDIALAAARARQLTQRLVALSQRTVPRPTDVDVGELLRELEPLMRRLAGPDVRMTVRAEGDGPVRVDRTGLEQVVLNLVVNARHAMPDGGELDVQLAREGDWVELRVRDTGVGMPPEVSARATEPFFTTRPAGEGTGLGLTTARHVATTAGGSLRLESAPGRGTLVCLRLRRVADAPQD
ncbi:PAS domain-containing sensor histidine kinase [Conexibacter sp. SYSU D00693]|uniref:PAS domain-containing sensor histidine kinase n=1 Tax=Conexibacter sp. SYSU D00693 TaxID=2812560 RepID=UPI00196AB04C|nr:PAS domain-containing sensor histidine kinase [Conexibacter sp. SYSU D00693]